MLPQKFSKDHLVLIYIRLKLFEKKFKASTAGDFFIMKYFFDSSESSKEKVKLDGQSMNADSDGNAEKNIRIEMKKFFKKSILIVLSFEPPNSLFIQLSMSVAGSIPYIP